MYCSDLLETSESARFVQWNGNTLNTPYKAGLTDCAEGFAFCYGNWNDYMTVIAFAKNSNKMWGWSKASGNWTEYATKSDLAKKIAELTEDLEELKSEKTMLLSSFDCSEDTGIAEVKKSVAAMEENLKRLTKQEEKYAAELEDALKQFSELREQAKNVDSAKLSEQRIALQGEKIQSATSKIKETYGEKFDPLILFDSKRDVSELLGEKTEVQSVREHLQKKQKQTAERKKTSKKHEQER